MDLSIQELGPAKLVVNADVAWQTVGTLERLQKTFHQGAVIVSSDLEGAVRSLVSSQSPWKNPVKHQDELDLTLSAVTPFF